TKRVAGWKAVDKYIAEQAYVLPLIQYAQPIVHAKGVNVVQHVSGALLPALMTPA
ncbi:MAG: peptide ABC transporter substrate-binding protein, partial [Mesorhizobium sp.]